MSTPSTQSFIAAAPHRPASPFRMALAVAACTFAVEILIMELYPAWDRGLSARASAAADAAMLSLVMIPVLHLAVYKPLRSTIGHLERTLEQLRLTGEIVEKTAEGIVIADSASRILHVNGSFSEITGYAADEAIGKTTSLLKSGLHDQRFYADMWQSLLASGEWQGEIWNRKKNGEIYLESLSITRVQHGPNKDVHFIGIFTQANHDRLTGLANRHLFMRRLEAALEPAVRSEDAVAVIFIDLDGFKEINDALGHDHGDRLLQSVGRALKHAMRPGDTAARLGGDEFAILAQGPRTREEAEQVAEAARAAIASVAAEGPAWARVAASIGVVVASGADGAEPLALLKSADEAMYAAKREGKNRIVVGAYRRPPPASPRA